MKPSLPSNGQTPVIDRAANSVEYDLHGIVGIRLLNAEAGDVAAVSKQLGPIQSEFDREPDIVIRFVDRLPLTSPVRYLGLDEVGFTDDAFLILCCKHRPVRVRIPFEQIGGRCEIVCESGLPAVPLLIPIVNLTALSKGVLPLHAAAFEYEGTGVVTTGWSKGGKTEMLLGFLAEGARYIGDEWVYLDGQRVYGIPEPMRLWDWHLQGLPEFRRLIGVGARLRMKLLKLAVAGCRLAAGPSGKGFPWTRLLNRVTSLLKRQVYVDVPPRRLLGAQLGPMSGRLDRLLFVVSHESAETFAEPIESREVAERMVFSLQYERLSFMAYYRMAQFAFPKLRNELIERAEKRRRELLFQILANKPAYIVAHPYPAPIPELVETTAPLLKLPFTTGNGPDSPQESKSNRKVLVGE